MCYVHVLGTVCACMQCVFVTAHMRLYVHMFVPCVCACEHTYAFVMCMHVHVCVHMSVVYHVLISSLCKV